MSDDNKSQTARPPDAGCSQDSGAISEKPIGEVTLRELSEANDAHHDVLQSLLDAARAIRKQGGEKMCDHLLRRIFTNGEAMKYDPGDEEPMRIEI